MGDRVKFRFTSFLNFLCIFTSVANSAPVPVTLSTHSSPSETGVHSSLTTSVGANLDSVEPNSSVSFEPVIQWGFQHDRRLDFASLIDRPFDPYKNFSVPKTYLVFRQGFSWLQDYQTAARLSTDAVDLDRWYLDGYLLKTSASFEIAREVAKGLTILMRVGPFVQFSQYSQRADGRDNPWGGLLERLYITYVTGRFTFEARLVVEQSKASVWKNNYSTSEQVQYQLTKGWGLGVSHELVSSVVDDSTGFYRPVKVFDGRYSRISAFVEMKL